MSEDPVLSHADLVERILTLAEEAPLPPERILAQHLGVNRYMLRKALGTLRDQASIPPSPVRKKSNGPETTIALHTSPVEVWEMRLGIEPEIARLAAIRGTALEIGRIEDIHQSSHTQIFDLEKDIAFHRAIAVASHNAMALYLIDQILDLTRNENFRLRLPEFTNETGFNHHQAILTAIQNRRAPEAEAAMRTHLAAVLQWLTGSS